MKANPQSEIRHREIEHVPVLLREAVDYLAPRPGGVYVDGTLGAGGHAEEVLRLSGPDGVVIGLDRDAEAVERSRERLSSYGARAVLRQANFRDLARIFGEYGEEQKAGAIARAIERARARGPITSTIQLAEIISSVFPPHLPRRTHPATRSFQALRIAVNDEVEALREGLQRAHGMLRPGGRMVVISFHSLEDRVVKQLFAAWAKGCTCPPRIPLCV